MQTVTATEIQNNFGKYLYAAQNGDEIVILKNGKEVARLISRAQKRSFLTDSLIGVLKDDHSEKDGREERVGKYEAADRH
ncbi:MAG: type II toxin-antitoxin system prevent-host-death family antitoxin [Clostridia bacterium]|nr:type II toxin-antitoxin system prevent-host-death family antitoxin [Clostridia bacterium]